MKKTGKVNSSKNTDQNFFSRGNECQKENTQYTGTDFYLRRHYKPCEGFAWKCRTNHEEKSENLNFKVKKDKMVDIQNQSLQENCAQRSEHISSPEKEKRRNEGNELPVTINKMRSREQFKEVNKEKIKTETKNTRRSSIDNNIRLMFV